MFSVFSLFLLPFLSGPVPTRSRKHKATAFYQATCGEAFQSHMEPPLLLLWIFPCSAFPVAPVAALQTWRPKESDWFPWCAPTSKTWAKRSIHVPEETHQNTLEKQKKTRAKSNREKNHDNGGATWTTRRARAQKQPGNCGLWPGIAPHRRKPQGRQGRRAVHGDRARPGATATSEGRGGTLLLNLNGLCSFRPTIQDLTCSFTATRFGLDTLSRRQRRSKHARTTDRHKPTVAADPSVALLWITMITSRVCAGHRIPPK